MTRQNPSMRQLRNCITACETTLTIYKFKKTAFISVLKAEVGFFLEDNQDQDVVSQNIETANTAIDDSEELFKWVELSQVGEDELWKNLKQINKQNEASSVNVLLKYLERLKVEDLFFTKDTTHMKQELNY